MFVVPHHEFGEGSALAFGHRGIEQVVRLSTANPGAEEVRARELNRVNLRNRNESAYSISLLAGVRRDHGG